jgi:hypothetical protein
MLRKTAMLKKLLGNIPDDSHGYKNGILASACKAAKAEHAQVHITRGLGREG